LGLVSACGNAARPRHDARERARQTPELGPLSVQNIEGGQVLGRELLRDGRPVEIRALRREDREDLIRAVGHFSAQSLYRRFFTLKRGFTEQEVDYFLDVDFIRHVALVATLNEKGQQSIIVGGARYILTQPGRAEVAFAVMDAYQGQGIGRALMRHLSRIARAAGLEELEAEVLPENLAMLKVFQGCGLPMHTTRDAGVVHVAMSLSQHPQEGTA
jgi:GNAT superfamily N-acetyltransferase